MKVKHAALLGGGDIKKPPRVIRTTEEVERALIATIHSPRGIGRNPPDFQAMRRCVLDALSDRPFESNRQVPEADPDAIASTKKIENGTFTVEEKNRIVDALRGADVPAWLPDPL